MPKIDSLTRQLIPFAPTVLRPSRLRMALFINELATLRHDSHNDSTATIPAAASSPSLASAPNYESADGVAYRGLTAIASLSMAVSVRDEIDYQRHVDYIHWNPVKHRLVDCVHAWPHSTFHRYLAQGVYSDDWGGVEMEMVGHGE